MPALGARPGATIGQIQLVDGEGERFVGANDRFSGGEMPDNRGSDRRGSGATLCRQSVVLSARLSWGLLTRRRTCENDMSVICL
jgi:hypothetical protein